MRREWPNLIGDGAYSDVPKILNRGGWNVPWPDGTTRHIEPVDPRRWKHIMEDHAPGGIDHRQFTGMMGSEIAELIDDAIRNGKYGVPDDNKKVHNFQIDMRDGRKMEVAIRVVKGQTHIWTAFPIDDPLRKVFK